MIVPLVLKWAIDAASAALSGAPVDFHTGTIRGDLAFYAGGLTVLGLLHWLMEFAMRW